MKPSFIAAALGLACAVVHAAEYSPYPQAGVYDGSDKDFSRELTIRPDGKFELEVTMKGKPGSNLRNGSGSGKFSDAPGGWDYREEGCYVTLKRAMGGMKLHVEGCAIAWGDVLFDGMFKPKGGAASSPAAAAPAAASPAGNAPLPTRKELLNQWTDLQVDKMAGKHVTAMARSMPADPKYTSLERYSQAAFVVDSSNNYAALSPSEQAKPPLQLITIPLPKLAANEGLLFQAGCSAGKGNKVIAVNLTRADGKGIQSRRHSAWMLDAAMQLQEVKPASKVKCPEVSSEY